MKLYDNDTYREEFMNIVYGLLMDDDTNDRANQIISAFDCAPEIEAEPTLPNNPMTIEELREMDGMPVWDSRWNVWGILDIGLCCVFTRNGDINLNLALATKRLYRRKQEEI